MTLDINDKLKTENFFRIVFKTFDVSNDGKISSEEVGKVLSAGIQLAYVGCWCWQLVLVSA